MSKKLGIKWNFELTVFELTVPDLYDVFPIKICSILIIIEYSNKAELLKILLSFREIKNNKVQHQSACG